MTFVGFLLGKDCTNDEKYENGRFCEKHVYPLFSNYQKYEMIQMVIIDKLLLRFVQIFKNK